MVRKFHLKSQTGAVYLKKKKEGGNLAARGPHSLKDKNWLRLSHFPRSPARFPAGPFVCNEPACFASLQELAAWFGVC